MTKLLFPHPLLSITLLGVWLMLVNTVTLGNVVLGGVLGVAIPVLTAAYWPGRPIVHKPLKGASYVLLVIWDIIVANFQVAAIVLFKPADRINSHWVTVPIDLRSPEAISVLAGTITMTPGTVTALLSTCGSSLLVHCLDTEDPDAVRDDIKQRYERRLKEIFE